MSVPSLSEFVVLGLAAHRLWAIWLYSELARPLRDRLTARGGWVGYLASCQFCISVWAGAAVTGLWVAGPWGQLVNVALAAGLLVFAWQELVTLAGAATARHQAHAQEAHLRAMTRHANGDPARRG